MAATKLEHFDLVFCSWIPVVTPDAVHREVGLFRLLRDAHRIRRIGGASPPMTAALHRFTLSILRRALGRLDEERWLALWAGDRLPCEPVKQYLAARRQRFDLFDPDRPFFQDPLLPAREVPRQLGALLRAAGQPVPDRRPGEMAAVLTPAEAARWLVTARLCPAMPPGAAGTSGYRFVGGLVEGADLRETLLLNLGTWSPASRSAPEEGTTDAEPTWSPFPGRERGLPRILLKSRPGGDSAEVTGVWLAPGDQGDPDRPERPSGPTRSLHQSLWRWYGDLLVGGGRRSGSRPGGAVREEVSTLAIHGWLSASAAITARLLAQGWSPTGPGTAVDLRVPLPVTFLAGPQPPGSPVRAAVALAEQVGAALDGLRAELRRQAVCVLDPRAEHEHWPALWERTSTLLSVLARAVVPAGESKVAAARWVRDLRTEVWRVVDAWVESSAAGSQELVRLHRALADFDTRLRDLVDRFLADMSVHTGSPRRNGSHE